MTQNAWERQEGRAGRTCTWVTHGYGGDRLVWFYLMLKLVTADHILYWMGVTWFRYKQNNQLALWFRCSDTWLYHIIPYFKGYGNITLQGMTSTYCNFLNCSHKPLVSHHSAYPSQETNSALMHYISQPLSDLLKLEDSLMIGLLVELGLESCRGSQSATW